MPVACLRGLRTHCAAWLAGQPGTGCAAKSGFSALRLKVRVYLSGILAGQQLAVNPDRVSGDLPG
jgi:hypothetical protein